VVTEYLRDPALPPPLDLSVVDPALLAGAPDRLLALTADLLLSGDTARGGEYVDLLERAQPPIEQAQCLGVLPALPHPCAADGQLVHQRDELRAIAVLARGQDASDRAAAR